MSAQPQEKKQRTGYLQGMSEVLQNLFFARKWFYFIFYFAVEEVRRQYARTFIGPMWMVLTQFVLIFSIAFVYSNVLNVPAKEFFPYLSAGIICWNLISMTISAAPSTLILNHTSLKSFEVPSSVFTAQLISRNLIQFVHALLVHFLVIILFKVPVNLNTVLILVSLPMVVAFLYGIGVLLAMAGARFRDIVPAVGSVMYLMFLCTPVFWKPSLVSGERAYVYEWNPFFYLLDAIRQPLLGQPTHESSLLAVTLMTVIVWLSAYISAHFVRRKAVFWV